MKFLNLIDGANKLVEDTDHRLVSDTEKAAWNTSASGGSPNLTLTTLTLGHYKITYNETNDTLDFEYVV